MSTFFSFLNTPLERFCQSIFLSDGDYQKANKMVEELKQELGPLPEQMKLPSLKEPVVKLNGSLHRKTALTPLNHIDVFLTFNPEGMSYDSQQATIRSQQPAWASSCDPTGNLIPSKALQMMSQAVSSLGLVNLTHSHQAIELIHQKQGMRYRITPAFKFETFWAIPEEAAEMLWKKVDPDRELQILDLIDKKHQNFIRPCIQIMKHWNQLHNNGAFRNTHLEMIAYVMFAEIPTPMTSLMQTLDLYIRQLPKYLYNCPDPTGLSRPVHQYLPDAIDQWYLYMNRVEELKTVFAKGEVSVVEYLQAPAHPASTP